MSTNEYKKGIQPSGQGFTVDFGTAASSVEIKPYRYIKTDTAEIWTVRMALSGDKVSLPLVAGVNPEQVSKVFSPSNHSASTVLFMV